MTAPRRRRSVRRPPPSEYSYTKGGPRGPADGNPGSTGPGFERNERFEQKSTRERLNPTMNCELCGRDGAEPARLDDERDALLCRECRDNYLPPEGPV
jgi:hypothetical protein